MPITKDYITSHKDKIYLRNGRQFIMYMGREYEITLHKPTKNKPVSSSLSKVRKPVLKPSTTRRPPTKQTVNIPRSDKVPVRYDNPPFLARSIKLEEERLKTLEQQNQKNQLALERLNLQTFLQDKIESSVRSSLAPPPGYGRYIADNGVLQDIPTQQVKKYIQSSSELPRLEKEIIIREQKIKEQEDLSRQQADQIRTSASLIDTMNAHQKITGLKASATLTPDQKKIAIKELNLPANKFNQQNTNLTRIVLELEKNKDTTPILENYVNNEPNYRDPDTIINKLIPALKSAPPRQAISLQPQGALSLTQKTGLASLTGTGAQSKKEYQNNIDKYGTSDQEINEYMEPYKKEGYLGTFASDTIKTIIPLVKKLSSPRLSFIYNSDKHNKPGEHWMAVYMDLRSKTEDPNAQSVEYYNSFATPIPKPVMKQLNDLTTELIKHFKITHWIKFKENKFVEQKANSYNCGWFSMKFLVDRYAGIPFKECTPYNISKTTEPDLIKFKNETKKFGYIYNPQSNLPI